MCNKIEKFYLFIFFVPKATLFSLFWGETNTPHNKKQENIMDRPSVDEEASRPPLHRNQQQQHQHQVRTSVALFFAFAFSFSFRRERKK